MPLCLLAFAALPLKAQRWVTEVGIEPAMFYQQYVAMDGGDAMLAVGSMHPSASSSACAEQSGRLLKVRSDGTRRACHRLLWRVFVRG